MNEKLKSALERIKSEVGEPLLFLIGHTSKGPLLVVKEQHAVEWSVKQITDCHDDTTMAVYPDLTDAAAYAKTILSGEAKNEA